MSHRARLVFVSVLVLIAFAGASFAADDPSIKGKLRKGIQASMEQFIEHQTVDGLFRYYDPVDGKLLHLERPKLHDGIVKKGDFYVSCADFYDQDGRKLDFDFLVVEAGGEMRTVQALLHKIEGSKRPYDVETN